MTSQAATTRSAPTAAGAITIGIVAAADLSIALNADVAARSPSPPAPPQISRH